MIQVGKSLEDLLSKYDIRHGSDLKCRCIKGAKVHLHDELIEFFKDKNVEQASVQKEMKCIFDGVTTYFSENGKAYCIDCYVKIRNSAHVHELPKNTPINPMPFPNSVPLPMYPTPYKFGDDQFPVVVC